VGATHSLDALILSYVGERIRRGEIQGNTARNIRNHLFLFAESFGQRPVDQLGVRAIERWVEQMEKAGTAKSTQALRLSSLRVFAKWCVRNGHVTKDWTMDAPQIRRARQIPRDMDRHHFELVLKMARDERERLIVWLMFGCGLRCVEVSRLNVDDYEKATGNLFVTGKALHERYVPVPLPVRAAIASYLATETHHSGALVRTHTDDKRRLGPGRISGIIGRLCREAGIKVRNYDGRSAHGLRSGGASDLMDECGDIRVVSEFLGHVNIATTDRYLLRRGLEKIREAQDRRFEDDDLSDRRAA
jgi:integrase/recombinase XerC